MNKLKHLKTLLQCKDVDGLIKDKYESVYILKYVISVVWELNILKMKQYPPQKKKKKKKMHQPLYQDCYW